MDPRGGDWQMVAVATLLLLVGCSEAGERGQGELAGEPATRSTSVDAVGLEQFITAQLDELHVPGVAVAIVDREGVVFSAGYGWADIDNQVPMTPDTVTNIASISKTVTNAAVLQLHDKGLLTLDDDVNDYLSFVVRHPSYPSTPITVRQLLTHTSGIEDGDAYDESYACGDPAVELGDWIRGYLVPGGDYFSAEQNFLPTAPGEAYSYSNVGFGLAGYLVEEIAGVPFAEFVVGELFEPLGMDESGFYLTDIDPGRRALPYSWIDAGDTLDNALFVKRNGEVVADSGFLPFCAYSFYNIPDGLVRTSVHQLARFLVAHMRGGELDGQRILATSTVDAILSPQVDSSMIEDEGFKQGLAWSSRSFAVGELWGHGGADPGIRSQMLFSPEGDRGVIVFANRVTRLTPILDRLLEEALQTPGTGAGP